MSIAKRAGAGGESAVKFRGRPGRRNAASSNGLRGSVSIERDRVIMSRARYKAMVARLDELEDLTDARRLNALVKTANPTHRLPVDAVRGLLSGANPVRVWRTHRGLSLRALARKAGVRPGYLSEIETGRKPGSAATLKAIAEALDAPLDELVT